MLAKRTIKGGRVAAALVVILYFLTPSRLPAPAAYLPPPLTFIVDHADLVVLATLEDYVPDAPATKPSGAMTEAEAFAMDFAFRDAGTYAFLVGNTLKGTCDKQIKVWLPFLSDECYGMRSFGLPRDSPVLVMLNRGADGTLSAADEQMPLIPMGQFLDPDSSFKMNKSTDWVDLLIASLDDAGTRPVVAHILRDVKRAGVDDALRPYCDDKDIRLRSDALYGMAVNQDLSAIPKIGELAKVLPGENNELTFYKDPKAALLLEPLVLDGPDLLRMNAMSALRPIATEHSLPFLMYALEHDDSQHTVAVMADATIHRLEPNLASPGQFSIVAYGVDPRRAAEIAWLKKWWADRQAATQPTAATMPSPGGRGAW